MAEYSLGAITPGSSGPVRLTANQTDPTAPVWAHKYRVQHFDNNTGRAFIGTSVMISGSGDGVYGYLNSPNSNWGNDKYESMTVEGQRNPYDLSSVYIDAENATDVFLVSYVEA